MNTKAGRNDPCPCGSGKKYKQCCLLKSASKKGKKLTAKWINAPSGPNLMERTFGSSIASTGKAFKAVENEDPKKEENPSERSD